MNHDKIKVLLRGDGPPVAIGIDAYLELVRWVQLATHPETMTLADAAAYLLPLAGLVVDALIKAGREREAARLVWAAAKLREAAKEEVTGAVRP